MLLQASVSDAREFTARYDAHKKAIFNYILYRIGFDHATAEDLTSEIFLKAYEHFDSYDRARPFKTWIFAIAHNHLVNHFTSRKVTLPLDEAIEVVKAVPLTDAIDTSMAMAKVLSIVDSLPPASRDLVIMRYVNDLTYTEIADITHKEEGAIRTALSRALETLRTQLSHESPL